MGTEVVRKFKAGDIVACVDPSGWSRDLTEGRLYEVVKTDEDGLLVIAGNMGQAPSLLPHRCRLHTSAEDLKELCDIFGNYYTHSFKVGDLAMCVTPGICSSLTHGKAYRVLAVTSAGITITDDAMHEWPYHHSRFIPLRTRATPTADTPPPSDPLNPPHYTRFKIQPLDFIRENNLDFLTGNVIKYVMRADAKNGREDLLKARRYLEEMLKRVD